MEFSVITGTGLGQPTGCIVVAAYEDGKLSPAAAAIDKASGGALSRVAARGDLGAELGTTLMLRDVPDVPAERVLLVGLGPEGKLREGSYRLAICSAIKTLRTTGTTDAAFFLHELPVGDRDLAWKIEQAVVAVMESTYRFDNLKTKARQPKVALDKVIFPVGDVANASTAQAAADRALAIADGIALAKDLGNLPANLCTPSYLAAEARDLGTRHGFKVTILERDDLERLAMHSFLAVARGSRQPPKLIVMEYAGAAHDSRPVVLVGKGITFDTGGISMKPATEMDEMKFDMCGAASVFGALHAVALAKLPLNVVGIVPATENMPDGNAIKPGDVVTTMSGQTVEILDTDAEGRVVLCDALTYAERYNPAAVVDVATLTGAIVTALGDVASGLFTNDESLARELLDAGDEAWDRAWRMPLWDEYQEKLKSNFADLPNVGTPAADAVIAACFLSRFTKAFPWAHLDIAGTASKSGEHKGATGRPVALLAHFLAARAAA